jgi:hypothetical protein
MKKRQSQLIKLIGKTLHAIREAGVRRYSHKFSPKKYSQHQHLACLVLKEFFHRTYRGITEELAVMDKIVRRLHLKNIPHYTTLQKFMKRTGNTILRQLVAAVAGTATLIGIDATGFSSSHASKHYEERIDRQVERRSFTKLSIAVDLDTQLIMAVKARKAPSHDNRDFLPLLKRLEGYGIVCGDKAYDAEPNYHHIYSVKALPVIPARKKVHKGTYRKKAQRSFNRHLYCQRSKVETVFSVLKRCFGDSLRGRSQWMRNKELSLKCFAYNLYRASFYLLTHLFYKALSSILTP